MLNIYNTAVRGQCYKKPRGPCSSKTSYVRWASAQRKKRMNRTLFVNSGELSKHQTSVFKLVFSTYNSYTVVLPFFILSIHNLCKIIHLHLQISLTATALIFMLFFGVFFSRCRKNVYSLSIFLVLLLWFMWLSGHHWKSILTGRAQKQCILHQISIENF